MYTSTLPVDEYSRNIINYIIKSNNLDTAHTDRGSVFRDILNATGNVCDFMPLVHALLCRYDLDKSATLTTERIAAQHIYNILADIHVENNRGRSAAKYTRNILDAIVIAVILVVLFVSAYMLPVNYCIFGAVGIFVIANILRRTINTKFWRPSGAKKISLMFKSATNTNDILQTYVWSQFENYTGIISQQSIRLLKYITTIFGRTNLFEKIIKIQAPRVTDVVRILKDQPEESSVADMRLYRYIIYVLYSRYAPGEIYTGHEVCIVQKPDDHNDPLRDITPRSNHGNIAAALSCMYTIVCIACLVFLLIGMIVPAPDDARIPLYYIIIIYGFIRSIVFVVRKCKSTSSKGILTPTRMVDRNKEKKEEWAKKEEELKKRDDEWNKKKEEELKKRDDEWNKKKVEDLAKVDAANKKKAEELNKTK